jgi:hypothetical protein
VAAIPLGLRGRKEVPPRPLHPRRAALGVRRGVVRRVPQPHRCRDVRPLHEPARLERIRGRLHLFDARPLGDGGLRGPHEGGGHRHPATRRGRRRHRRDGRGSPRTPTASRLPRRTA